MSARCKPTSSYLRHKQSGRARAVWTDQTGTRHQQLLPGGYDRPESRTAFARLQLELESSPHRTQLPDPDGITVNELLAAYLEHAGRHYRGPDGKPTGEIHHIKVVCRHVRELYGFSRLRKDANLRTVPAARSGKRGRPRIYGERRIDLAERGGQRHGWATGTFTQYGEPTAKRYKTFVAPWRPAGGGTRVVVVDEPTGWVVFFRTDPAAGVADVLEAVAARFRLEVAFHDRNEVVGVGQQQVRRVRASVGAFHVCLWTFTTTEAWAWGRDTGGLVGHRSASPWDDEARRPSHADKRRAWRRELLAEQIHTVRRPGRTEQEIQAAAERLPDLAA